MASECRGEKRSRRSAVSLKETDFSDSFFCGEGPEIFRYFRIERFIPHQPQRRRTAQEQIAADRSWRYCGNPHLNGRKGDCHPGVSRLLRCFPRLEGNRQGDSPQIHFNRSGSRCGEKFHRNSVFLFPDAKAVTDLQRTDRGRISFGDRLSRQFGIFLCIGVCLEIPDCSERGPVMFTGLRLCSEVPTLSAAPALCSCRGIL